MWNRPDILRLVRTTPVLLITLLIMAAPSPGSLSDTAGQWSDLGFEMPLSLERVVHLFDFEERDDGNFEEMPMHWSRVTGPGLPHFVRGALEARVAHSGQYSFRLDLNGGSALYRLNPTRLAVQPGAYYRVTGYARTTPLHFAKARVTGYFVDATERMLPETLRHSRLVAAETGEFSPPVDGDAPVPGHDWQRVVIELPQAPAAAAFVVLEVGLLQPNQLGPRFEGKSAGGPGGARNDVHRFRQDIVGSAWFDDLSICRVPAVQLSSPAPGNVFRADEPVRFAAIIDDQFVTDLVAEAKVYDNAGQCVAEVHGEFEKLADREDVARVEFKVPQLSTGWYELHVTVGADEEKQPADPDTRTTSERVMSFVVLAEEEASAPLMDRRITVDASHLHAAEWLDLPTLLPTLAAGRVKLALWNRHSTLGRSQSTHFDRLAQSLGDSRIRITGVLAEPTPELIERSGTDDWARMIESLPAAPAGGNMASSISAGTVAELWYSSLSYLVSRHAAQVDRWQVGRDADASRFPDEPAMRRVYRRFATGIAELVHRPDLAMPWPARERFVADDEKAPASLELEVPQNVLPRQIPLYVDEFLRNAPGDGTALSLSLQLPGPHVYGPEAQLADLAKRLTYALASGIDRITIPMPFEPVTRPTSVEHQPQPHESEAQAERVLRTPQQPLETYLVLRAMLPRLAEHTFAGRLEVDEGIEAFLFASDVTGGQGVVVAWDRGAAAEPRERLVQLNLHPGAHQVDIRGETSQIAPAQQDAAAGWVRLSLGTSPTIIVGVNSELTRLRGAIRLDRPGIESRFEPHVRRVRFENTFSRPISGTLELRGPNGWEITPIEWAGGGFSLNPGERFDRAVEIRFPYNSYAGENTLEARMRVTVAGEQHEVVVPITVRLGLEDVGLRTVAFREGGDLVVEQTVTNYGRNPINYNAFVLAPDQPRQERLVANLAGGQAVVRRYRFPEAANLKSATVIRTGLRELEGTRILNDRVELP